MSPMVFIILHGLLRNGESYIKNSQVTLILTRLTEVFGKGYIMLKIRRFMRSKQVLKRSFFQISGNAFIPV